MKSLKSKWEWDGYFSGAGVRYARSRFLCIKEDASSSLQFSFGGGLVLSQPHVEIHPCDTLSDSQCFNFDLMFFFQIFMCAWKGVFQIWFSMYSLGIFLDLPPWRPVILPGAAGTQRWLNGCCELAGLVLFKGEGGGADPSGCGDGTSFPPQKE